MTSFTEKVLTAAGRILRGKVSTYREVARAIGSPRAVRAVGNALNRNPYPYGAEGLPAGRQVPCHRVVRSDGRLGGYASGPNRKAALLSKEGVKVVKGKVDLKKFGYALR